MDERWKHIGEDHDFGEEGGPWWTLLFLPGLPILGLIVLAYLLLTGGLS